MKPNLALKFVVVYGELRGKSLDRRARPASIAPARTKAKEFKTQADNKPVPVKCRGTDVTISPGNQLYCPAL